MKRKVEIKKGDIVTAKYKWGNVWKSGIGYVYEAAGLIVGLSSKDGGVLNICLNELKDVKKLTL